MVFRRKHELEQNGVTAGKTHHGPDSLDQAAIKIRIAVGNRARQRVPILLKPMDG